MQFGSLPSSLPLAVSVITDGPGACKAYQLYSYLMIYTQLQKRWSHFLSVRSWQALLSVNTSDVFSVVWKGLTMAMKAFAV